MMMEAWEVEVYWERFLKVFQIFNILIFSYPDAKQFYEWYDGRI